MDDDAIVAFIVTGLFAAIGIATLLFRDYRQERMRRRLPLFPPALSALLTVIRYIAFCALVLFLFKSGWAFLALLIAGTGIFLWGNGDTNLPARLKQQAAILRELAESSRRSLPLEKYFDALAAEYRGGTSDCSKLIASRLREGESLSRALERVDFLPPHAIAAIRASEASGGASLPDILERSAAGLDSSSQRMHVALFWGLYLLSVLSAWSAVALFQLNIFSTRFVYFRMPVKWWETFMLGLKAAIAFSVVAVVVLLLVQVASGDAGPAFMFRKLRSAFRDFSLWLQNNLPYFRARLRHRCMARCAEAIGTMTNAGVPLHTACALLAVPAMAGPFAVSLMRFSQDTKLGVSIADAARNAGLPPAFSTLAQAGAAGGHFSSAMSAAADWHETRARNLDQILLAAIPCFALPLCGVLVGGLYAGMLLSLVEMVRLLIPFGLGQ